MSQSTPTGPGRRSRLRWLAAIPGLLAFAVLGPVIEEGTLVSALPYVLIVICSATYVAQPSGLAWAILFGAFFGYGLMVALLLSLGPPDAEGVFFMLMGFGPAILLLVARSRAGTPADPGAAGRSQSGSGSEGAAPGEGPQGPPAASA